MHNNNEAREMNRLPVLCTVSTQTMHPMAFMALDKTCGTFYEHFFRHLESKKKQMNDITRQSRGKAIGICVIPKKSNKDVEEIGNSPEPASVVLGYAGLQICS